MFCIGVLALLLLPGFSIAEAVTHCFAPPPFDRVNYIPRIADETTEDICYWGYLQKTDWNTLAIELLVSGLGLYSGAVIIERLLSLRAARRQTRSCLPHFALAARHGSIEEATIIAAKHPKSQVSSVFVATLQGFHSASGGRESRDCAQGACLSAIRTQRLALSRGLGSLRTIAVTVPILGLMGGCAHMVHGLRLAQSAEATSVLVLSPAFADCLTLFAFSLAIAVVSFCMRSLLASQVRMLVAELENSSENLLGMLRSRGGRKQHATNGSWVVRGLEEEN